MNYPVGVRTRLCSALAAGNICIVHNSILGNMPELKKCKSIFFIKSKKDYSLILKRIRKQKSLYLLKKESIKFFNENYKNNYSSKIILDYFKNY